MIFSAFFIIFLFYIFNIFNQINGRLILKSSNTFEEVKIGLDTVSGSVVAYGDFNSDKFTDVFVLDSSLQKLSVYLWQTNTTSFEHLNSADIDVSSDGLYILNVIPNDFNYDGKLDVLIMASKEKTNKPNNELIMRLYKGNQKSFDKFINIPSSMNIQPTLIDYFGNMHPNLLGYPYNKDNTYKLHVWKFNDDNVEVEEVSIKDEKEGKELCKISLPHSNAFIDLDGDCLSDLFVTCEDGTFEIWKNTVDKGFVFSRSGKLPENTGPISFADMDGDGTIDMIFYEYVTSSGWSKKKEWNLHIVYNKQIPLCSKAIESNCRSVHHLCTADNNYNFDFNLEGDGHVKIQINEPIQFDNLYDKANIPIPIRIGDINMDGYPDIVLSIKDSTKTIELYESVPCTEKLGCTDSAVKANRRTLVFSDHSKVLNRRQNLRSAAFMDIEENGTVDILLFGEQDKNKKIYTVINNLHNDAFFMKTITLNGACSSICSSKNEKYSPFGVNYIGSTFKFTVIDLVGQKRANQVAQLPQSNYNALQTPYCLFGLGRTNSYMEELFVGVSRRNPKYYNIYSGMIPNSQLIIIPYQQENEDPSSWQLKQFINPSEYVPYVFISLVCTIVILIVITLLLQLLEKREDELEKKRALHIINFDAF